VATGTDPKTTVVLVGAGPLRETTR